MKKRIFDYNKLIGRIIEKFGTRRRFAVASGQSPVNLNNKLTGKTQINSNDIALYCDLLDIDFSEIPLYFFTVKV